MSLYKDYVKERGIFGIVERDYGFVTYYLNNFECVIEDMYIRPEDRRGKKASNLADTVVDVAKQAGCKYVTCQVAKAARNAQDSISAIKSYGFNEVFEEETEQARWFLKEI